MSSYNDLIQRIFSHSQENKVQALRKLIYLAVNDQNKFSQFVPQIAQQLPKILTDFEDEQVKLLSLQLLSEMATNFTTKIPAECYSFPQLVGLLSDENAEVRKASHYLILIFIKKYEQIDEVIEGYLDRIKEAPQHWKVLQKIIHSFQSLLVIEPKCITYSQDFTYIDDFLKVLLSNRNHHHSLVQKASEQTVNSFVKNQYVPQILPKLDRKIMLELVDYAQKVSINLMPRKKSPEKQPMREVEDIEEIRIVSRKTSVLEQLMVKLDSESDWKIKSQAIEQISNELTNGNSQIPDDLVQKVLDLTYDYNFKTCITAMNVLLTLSSLHPSKLTSRHKQIEDVVIQKICDLKMAVRQLANKILRNLYPNQSKDFLKRLLTKLKTCSVVGKQQILNFLQQIFTSNIISDLGLVLGQIANQMLNQNTRINIKAMDCLVKITMSNQLEECKMILSKKLNKVYYQMFLERLRDKMGVERVEIWEEKGKGKKGMTWQAPERGYQVQLPEKQAQTKIQFGNNKKSLIQTEQQFGFTGLKSKDKGLSATNSNSKTSNTANSFNTFKSTQDGSNYTGNPRFQKKNNQPLQSSQGVSVFQFQQNKVNSINININANGGGGGKEAEKKLPMKPNPIKKKYPQDQAVNANIKEDNGLIVQSKEYQNKNNEQDQQQHKNSEKKVQQKKESIQQKPKMKITKTRDRPTPPQPQPQQLPQPQIKQIPSQPFTIKKSNSVKNAITQKKQHFIDYKATHYTTKDDLSPLENPKQTLKFIMLNLPKDNDWSKQFQSLDFLRRIIKNHQDLYPVLVQNLGGVMPEVLKLVESLRSSVAKNAMITLSEMCEALKKAMDAYLEPLFVKLFKKAQDANSFIVEEVKKCMSSLCTYCSSPKILSILISNSCSKSTPIKINIAICIDKILQKYEYDCQILKENNKIVNVMSNFIIDGAVQVRNLVKDVFAKLVDVNGAVELQGIFRRASSKDAWEKWRSIMDRRA